ncbi:MAG TPA: geranylgeranyl reductase family protein [Luteimicrobium sp.]|nr:geranylgeranyl reductase family protein [Luteimicrobium sp.]
MSRPGTSGGSADVIVVGAGPAGSATAAWCAAAGLDVLLLERSAFPRDKVCGDGLTPRAVGELERLGVRLPRAVRNAGLRLVADGRAHELRWPDVPGFPSYGLALARTELDEALARHAERAGATLLERTHVVGPELDARSGRVVGVVARAADERGRATGDPVTYRAPVVVAADGVSSRFAVALGLERREDRPIGVAVRTYAQPPSQSPWGAAGDGGERWMESHVELWEGAPRTSAPLSGYGWLFPLADGTVNVGLGAVHSTPARQSAADTDHRRTLDRWVAGLPDELGLGAEHRVAPVRGAALPMGLNRTPLATRGALLVGDAAGMVSPFNGEGIGFGLQAGRIAGEVVPRALAARSAAERERLLTGYDARVRAELGGFYTLGRYFTRLIEQPALQRLAVRHGLPRRAVMDVVLRLFSDCYDPHGGDWVDRTVAAAARLVPSA